MHFKLKTTSLIVLIGITSLNVMASSTVKCRPCSIATMLGTQPQALCNTIENFNLAKSPENFGIKLLNWINRLVLYGPPGNGKTTVAQEIATLTHSVFIKEVASNLVTQFQGSGSLAIKKIFQNAKALIQQGKSVVIFIDEIDAIVSKNIPDNHHDTHAAMQTFWCELLEHEHINNLLIIVATNNKEEFHETFDSRFPSNCAIEMENPTAQNRKETIQKHFMLARMPRLNEKTVEDVYSDMDVQFRAKHALVFQEYQNDWWKK